jgi:ribonuclease VapC
VERLGKRTGLSKTALVERAIDPPGPVAMEAAYAAYVAFGTGSGHPAALNFGDVFSDALAKARGLPLFYKGVDFAETDIASAPTR